MSLPKLTLSRVVVEELALTLERQLFPSHYPSPPPPATNAKPAAPTSASTRCSERACPYPSVSDGRCRSHLLDATMQRSLLPSTTAAALSNLGHIVT